MKYKVSFYHLKRSLILTCTFDLFYYLIVFQIGVNNTFPQFNFLNMLEEIEIHEKDHHYLENMQYRYIFYEELIFE